MRDSASWYIGCSRITELPSGERDEDVVERGVMRRQRRELEPPLLQQREQCGQRAVQLDHRQRESDATHAGTDRGHAAEPAHSVRQVSGGSVPDRELDDVLRAERGDQLARRPKRNDLAVIHDRDAVAQALGFLHVVGREQHGPAVRAEPADDFPQLPSRLRIQAGRRLIEEQQLGFADERARDGEALLLAARERHDARLALFLEPDEREHLVDRVRLPVERPEQRQHLADLELVGELGFLELNAEALAQRPSGGAVAPRRAEDLDLTRIRERQPLEDFDGSGLAGTVGSEQSKAFARLDDEIETRNGDDVPEPLGERATVDRYDGFFSLSSLSFSGVASCAALSAWSSCMVMLLTPSASARTFILSPVPDRPATTAS